MATQTAAGASFGARSTSTRCRRSLLVGRSRIASIIGRFSEKRSTFAASLPTTNSVLSMLARAIRGSAISIARALRAPDSGKFSPGLALKKCDRHAPIDWTIKRLFALKACGYAGPF